MGSNWIQCFFHPRGKHFRPGNAPLNSGGRLVDHDLPRLVVHRPPRPGVRDSALNVNGGWGVVRSRSGANLLPESQRASVQQERRGPGEPRTEVPHQPRPGEGTGAAGQPPAGRAQPADRGASSGRALRQAQDSRVKSKNALVPQVPACPGTGTPPRQGAGNAADATMMARILSQVLQNQNSVAMEQFAKIADRFVQPGFGKGGGRGSSGWGGKRYASRVEPKISWPELGGKDAAPRAAGVHRTFRKPLSSGEQWRRHGSS